MPDTYTIYCFIDNKDKPYYVGQTASLIPRLKMHMYLLKGKVAKSYKKASQYPYYRKTRKLIRNGHKFRVLVMHQNISKEKADKLEIYYIDKYRKDPSIKLYNILPGGRSGQKGKFVSEETKRKISEAKKGKKLSEAHKQALRKPHKTPTRTPEQRKQWIEKISAGNLGKKRSQEAIEKNRLCHIGKRHSKEANKKKGRFGKDHHSASNYELINPAGAIYIVVTFKEAADISGLKAGNLRFACREGKGTYKGWAIKELS